MDTWMNNNMQNPYSQIQILDPAEGIIPGEETFTKSQRLQAMVRPLLAWYHKSRRVLPWREDPQPYKVWISEIMLQQTRVEAVKPYFARFMEALPTVESLAMAEEERLLKLWEGLGYYNRARNLQKAAKEIMDTHEGRIPDSYTELLKLPGIGSYTAGAIASIAYGAAVPAVDGNVLRVLSRILASRDDILKQSVKKQMERDIKPVIPADEAGAFNQSLIEIGALVCVPSGAPLCGQCPVEGLCLAKRHGLLDEIPLRQVKAKRRTEKKTVCVITDGERVLLDKRPDTGLLASLYELPNREGHLKQEELAEAFNLQGIRAVEPLPSAKHIFSHIEWHMIGYRVLVDQVPEDKIQAKLQDLSEKYPLPNAFQKYMNRIL